MKQKGKQKKKWKLLKMPKLSLYFRLLLYLLMFLSGTLSLVSVAFEYFPYRTEMVFYILAPVTLFGGSYYLIWDIRYGIKEIIRPSIAANPFTNRVSSDYRMRTILFAVPVLVSNIVFVIFNGVTGFMSHSAWFGSLSAYYILLSIIRIGAVKHEKKISKIKQNKERMAEEIRRYDCGF